MKPCSLHFACPGWLGRTTALGSLLVSLFLASVAQLPAGGIAFADGLVAHWAFNEMTGTTVLDASTNAFSGTLAGGVWTNGASLYDGALAFDGTNDAVYFPAASTPPPAKIGQLAFGSIALRFRFAATGSPDIIPLFYFVKGSVNEIVWFSWH
jgi:hypothetical protein